MKKVTFGGKPAARPERVSADEWVNDQSAGEPMKRLTIDVPLGLHKRIKSQCASEGVKMADVVRDMLDRRFPAGSAGEGRAATGSADTETHKAG